MDPLLERMLADMESAPEPYRPTRFWRKAIGDLVEEIEEHGVESFRRLPACLLYFVPVYGQRSYLLAKRRRHRLYRLARRIPKIRGLARKLPRFYENEIQAAGDYRVFLATDSSAPPDLTKVSEDGFGKPLEQFEFEGRSYSRSLLNYLRGLTFLKRHTDTTSLRSVLEIGGGYGTLGEILLKSDPSRFFYVNVDIPPVGFVATRYLQAAFGRSAVLSYDVTREWDVIDLREVQASHRAVVLCPWQLPRTRGELDLFVNFISFQEMEPEIVENYARHVAQLGCKTLLMRNSRQGKPRVSKRICSDDYPRFFPGFELVAKDALVHGDQSTPSATAPENRYSEVTVFRKQPA